MEAIGKDQGKLGLVVIKRRAGKGKETPRLIVLTEAAWEKTEEAGSGAKVRQSA